VVGGLGAGPPPPTPQPPIPNPQLLFIIPKKNYNCFLKIFFDKNK